MFKPLSMQLFWPHFLSVDTSGLGLSISPLTNLVGGGGGGGGGAFSSWFDIIHSFLFIYIAS